MRTLLIALILFSPAPCACAYSVMTHEAIIDSAWDASIQPLLLQRYPGANSDQLLKARAFAYGGCIIQDMGYYPFGSKFFTDLIHYVRSGDFVMALVMDAQDLSEYAFALGSLAHYAADSKGHPIAINRAVPLLYPKLRRKYGDTVTYAQNPGAHVKVEFGLDVVQIARGSYASKAYHDFIGFEVSKPLLERAFRDTYCMEMKDLFASLDLALGTYRHSVSTIIPEMTKVAWQTKEDEILKSHPGITREKFLFKMTRPAYEREWGNRYEKPGPVAKLLAMVMRLIPRFGFLKALSFKAPTPEAERLFIKSLEETVSEYRQLLLQVKEGRLKLINVDFDTGRPAEAGEYRLSDETYAKLVLKLEERDFANISPALRQNLLSFYAHPRAAVSTQADRKKWLKVKQALERLSQTDPGTVARPAAKGSS